MVYCIYHRADLDGKCSAALVLAHLPGEEVRLIPADYPDDPDQIAAQVPDGATVYMVDFSLPIDRMIALAGRCELVWIDHHISALRGAVAAGFDPPGLRIDGWAGCELVWQFFDALDDGPPEVVELLGRYDVWDAARSDWNTHILPFQYGMRLHHWLPEDQAWLTLFGPHAAPYIIEVLQQGRAILKYQRQQDEGAAHEAFDAVLDGFPVLALNSTRFTSQALEHLFDPKRHAAMLVYRQMKDGRWKVGLYSTREDIDCSVIAKSHGGGGHRGAAGFMAPNLDSLTRPA